LILVVEQPSYVPWLGYFDLMAQADVWVWLDDVQFTRRDWRNRNRIAGAGEPFWLTVPVRSHGRFAQRIVETEIDPSRPWVRKHLEAFRHCYASAPHFQSTFDLYRHSLEQPFRLLANLTIELAEAIARQLALATRFVRSSELEVTAGDPQQRLLELCRRLGADTYLSGPRARAYIDPRSFAAGGIELRYVVYGYPPYPRGSRDFVPRLSVLDPLSWLGPAATAAFLDRHGHRTEAPAAAEAAAW
jgi:hypothetical protein